ncbi:hypothetical protein NTE_00887 [Candidatus Nitrososphaera evergladensis SR1]|uniref:Uncharacterized protein n=2 Tax=Nitrososphaera TaxID=497726 RepID=A0A075MP23_9ARCH|nr:hypothetical protein NTE_00887 [Candidatus Nitrososphaera evergladensis SR1]
MLAFMLIANAVNGLVLWNFFPLHMRGAEMTFTDTMHVILAAMGGIFGSLAIGFGAVTFGKRFLFYSVAAVVMLFAPTILAFSFVPQVAANFSVVRALGAYRICGLYAMADSTICRSFAREEWSSTTSYRGTSKEAQ